MFKTRELFVAVAVLSMSIDFAPAVANSQNGHMDHGDHKMMTEEAIETAAVIHSVDAEARKINVTHEPIPAISWPKMTMDFAVMKHVDLSSVKTGSTVKLTLARGTDGIYAIRDIKAHDEEQHH